MAREVVVKTEYFNKIGLFCKGLLKANSGTLKAGETMLTRHSDGLFGRLVYSSTGVLDNYIGLLGHDVPNSSSNQLITVVTSGTINKSRIRMDSSFNSPAKKNCVYYRTNKFFEVLED